MPLNLSGGGGEDVSVTTLSRYESAELWLYASQPFWGGGGKMCQLLHKVGMRVLVYLSASRERYVGVQSELCVSFLSVNMHNEHALPYRGKYLLFWSHH